MSCIAGWQIIKRLPNGPDLAILIFSVCIGSLLFFRVIGARRFYSNRHVQAFFKSLPSGERIYAMLGCFNLLRERPLGLLCILGLSMLNHVFWCVMA